MPKKQGEPIELGIVPAGGGWQELPAGALVPSAPVDPRNVTIHNRTGADISMWHKEFVQAASSGALPEELADLFTINVVRTGEKVRVTVDFS